ncbi:MAG TPA: response regulator transcription factor [Coriobacteriia bacterium]
MIKVAIVDDHQLVREGLVSVLETVEDIQVVGSYRAGQELIDALASSQPDLVVMDMRLPDGLGSTWTEAVKRQAPDVKVLVLTGFHSDDKLLLALDACADGFMYKESSKDELIQAVHEVARGDFHLSPEAARKLRDLSMPSAGSTITPREAEVLMALRDGLTTEEIASRLMLSASTVKTHLGSAFRKLGARNRVEAVREAILRGIVSGD